MKTFYYLVFLAFFIFSCGTPKKNNAITSKNLPEGAVRIANDSLQYEVIIIDPGFETYLITIARPANFYSQEFYENKNKFYITEWNIRAKNPLRFNSSIYENEINYDFGINYGLEVNYKLYNYFKFVEHRYKQKF